MASKRLSFQLVSWWAQDVECENESEDDEDKDDKRARKPLEYTIKLFGRDKSGQSVSCTVTDFTPYFFVKLLGDRMLSSAEIARFTDAVYQKLNKPWLNGCIVDARIIKNKDFWGFSNGKQFNFLRLSFKAERHMKQIAKGIAESSFFIPGIYQKSFQLYESNIAPFLRFAHIQKIAPAGWISVPRAAATFDDVRMPSRCSLDFQTHWKQVIGELDRTDIAPLKIAAFDIECMSSDMDFPVAQKNYVKVASDIFNLIHGGADNGNNNAKCNWKQEMVQIVVGKYESRAMVPFEPISKAKVEDTIFQHGDHIMLIVKGDKTIVDNAMRQLFEKVGLTLSTLAAMLVFVDKVSKTATSTTATRLAMGSWLRKAFANTTNKANNDVEANVGRIIGLHMREKDAIVEILTAYLDSILPAVKGDEIIQIGITSHRYGQPECSERVMVSLGSCDPIAGVRIVECANEHELIHKWVDEMVHMDPDIVCGYNIFGFDFKFIHGRAEELGCISKTEELSRLLDRDYPAQFKEARLSSSALGDNVMYYYDMPGRTCVDLMKVIQRDHKLDSYKLDAVAAHFMGMNKKDVSPADIFRLAKGSAADRAIVADYCIQDCELCNHLVMKLEIVANNAGMASVCCVPLHYIFMRGQGVKIFSLVAKMCQELGYVVPTLKYPGAAKPNSETDDVDGYEGAIVLEPKVGMYIDTPVAVLDYASLYPSSMISENLSHDCIVLEPKYDNIPGIAYKDVAYDLYEGVGEDKVKIGEKNCRYAHKSTGVIPFILQDLLKQRKLTRKRMSHKRLELNDGTVHIGSIRETDEGSGVIIEADNKRQEFAKTDVKDIADAFSPFEKATLDGLQLAYKITANSLYGQVGSKTSPIYLKDIAACTTATGRRMILTAKDFLEKNYDANIIYGDSVPGYTACVIRVGGTQVEVTEIEQIAKSYGSTPWITCIDSLVEGVEGEVSPKEGMQIQDGIDTWTNSGWVPLRRIIRHVLAPQKSIIRVSTPHGVVDVTDDHSLIKADGSIVSPTDLGVGDVLLGNYLGHTDSTTTTTTTTTESAMGTEEHARFLGMFLVSGMVDATSNVAFIGGDCGLPESLMVVYKTTCEKAFPRSDWVVEITSANSAVLKPFGPGVPAVMEALEFAYPSLLLRRTVPSSVLNAPLKIKHAFWNGVVDGCGGGRDGILTGTQACATSLMILMRSIGLVPWLEVAAKVCSGDVCYTIRFDACPRAPFRVYKFAKIPCVGKYVYDLTTENHQFHAGAGFLIVHNTDSLFVRFPKQVGEKKGSEALRATIDTAVHASDAIKPSLPSPHDLEYEKTYWPFILFSKKRYVANQYGHNTDKFKQSSMGIVLKRRDNAQIVKIIYGGVIDILLNRHDVASSIEFLVENLNALADGKRGLDDLIISKSLKAHYKDPSKIAHKVLADRIKERNPGNAPQVNDRIPYVYVVPSQAGKLLQGDKIEHPDFIRAKQLRPDYEFYITNQIMKPVLQLYALVLEQLPGYTCERGYWDKVARQLEAEGKSVRFIKEKIREMREAEVKKLMFDPILKRIRHDPAVIAMKNRREGNRSITEWYAPKKSI